MGRPTLEQQAKKKAALEAQQKLFDTEPFTVSLPKKQVRYPKNVDINDWLNWCFEYLILNKDCISLLDIYEDENIEPAMSFLDTVNAHDPNIENILEQRIVKKVLEGKVKSDFAKHYLSQKFNWNEDENNVSLSTDEINFQFG
jgi:hypothetical protein